ncbi:MAG: FecR family protein [Methanosarcina sp.]
MKRGKSLNVSEIAAKYLSGNGNAEEIEFLKKYINESEENAQYFSELRNIWGTEKSDCNFDQIDTLKALKEVSNRISNDTVWRRLWITWGRIAAILIIPLAAWNLMKTHQKSPETIAFQEPVYNEVYATFGTRTALRLADSSLVWLNSGSSLKYPDKFTGSTREVYLNGEAYFEVKSKPEMPFLVRTSDIVVKATGTKFNVLGFKKSKESEVTLVSGKVAVSGIDDTGKDTLISDLFPDQHLVINKCSGDVSMNTEDTYKYISWKDGKLIFRNEPLSVVTKKLSQVYNVDIEIQGEALRDYTYRATFEDETLADILKLLQITSPIGYMELKRAPLPDGTFPRKKVIIYALNLNDTHK